MRAARKDGVYSGVLSTRTSGLVRLPKRFWGNEDMKSELERKTGEGENARSVFDEMFPPAELALLAADGIELGVGVAELLPVPGRSHPVMQRLDPEFLQYRWMENQWYYHSNAGFLPIFPGDGHWILHIPGGRVAPWHHGLWRAIGEAWITKSHAKMHRANWEAKLANPARVAIAPQGASEEQKQSWFQRVMAWGINTVFGLTPGYDVKLLESNGRGYESFKDTIAEQNQEMIVAVAGQTVTVDGGTGFANADVHKSIRADLIKDTADSLATTINTQGLPMWAVDNFGGESALDDMATVEWDVTPPKDRVAEATAAKTTAEAITSLSKALADHGLQLDVEQLATQMAIPLKTDGSPATPALPTETVLSLARTAGMQVTADSVVEAAGRLGLELESLPEGEAPPVKLDLAPTDIAKVVLVKEARASQGLGLIGDDRDDKTVSEMGAEAEEGAKTEGELAVVDAEAEAEEEATEVEEEDIAA